MSFWRKINPIRAVQDFAGEWGQSSPHRWPALGVAIAMTGALMWMLLPASQRGAIPRPTIIYISSWSDDRTDEEIIASNIENQARKDVRAAAIARRDERRKDMYRTLGRATGLDVDEMEAKIERDNAAAQAAEAAAAEARAQANANITPDTESGANTATADAAIDQTATAQ